jgi:hypothetical protein
MVIPWDILPDDAVTLLHQYLLTVWKVSFFRQNKLMEQLNENLRSMLLKCRRAELVFALSFNTFIQKCHLPRFWMFTGSLVTSLQAAETVMICSN